MLAQLAKRFWGDSLPYTTTLMVLGVTALAVAIFYRYLPTFWYGLVTIYISCLMWAVEKRLISYEKGLWLTIALSVLSLLALRLTFIGF